MGRILIHRVTVVCVVLFGDPLSFLGCHSRMLIFLAITRSILIDLDKVARFLLKFVRRMHRILRIGDGQVRFGNKQKTNPEEDHK